MSLNWTYYFWRYETGLPPYDELSERYFSLRDCEADALLDVVRRSRFIRSISHDGRANAYFIRLSNNDVLVSFTYYVAERNLIPESTIPAGSISSGLPRCLEMSSTRFDIW